MELTGDWNWQGKGEGDTRQQVAWGNSMVQRTAGMVVKDFIDQSLITPNDSF